MPPRGTGEGAGERECSPMSANALRLAWERLKKRAGIRDLRFHDLRREAISRFFEIGLSIPEVSLISGQISGHRGCSGASSLHSSPSSRCNSKIEFSGHPRNNTDNLRSTYSVEQTFRFPRLFDLKSDSAIPSFFVAANLQPQIRILIPRYSRCEFLRHRILRHDHR